MSFSHINRRVHLYLGLALLPWFLMYGVSSVPFAHTQFFDQRDRAKGLPQWTLRSEFGSKIAPLQVPIGAADTFRGVVDVVHRKAYEYQNGTRTEVAIPAELEAEVATRRDQLLEAAAEADDDVLTKYLEGEEVTDQELDACLHKGVRERVLAPVLFTSAGRDVGITELLDAVVRYLPSPAEEPPVKAEGQGGSTVEVGPDPSGPLVAQVFKTTADPFVGRLSYFRVWSGKIKSHDHVWNPEREIGRAHV